MHVLLMVTVCMIVMDGGTKCAVVPPKMPPSEFESLDECVEGGQRLGQLVAATSGMPPGTPFTVKILCLPKLEDTAT